MLEDSTGKNFEKGGNQYRVIALRWRPRTFGDVIGQEHIVTTLTNAIKSGRIAHAYIFIGPRGTGKTTTARLLAMALNSRNGPSVDFDPDDDISRSIASGNCLDVIEIDGASNNSVEQIRALRDECRYTPVSCKYKIYIIDEVHMLSNAAFNALLKTLEEPPPHVKFIFATTEAHKVLPTITSRCQRFSFRPVPIDSLAGKLAEIAKIEGINITDEALSTIARLANGGVRDAESILDRMVAFCDGQISVDTVNAACGLADAKTVEAIVGAMYYGDYGKLMKISREIAIKNCDMYRVLCDVEMKIHEQLANILEGGGNYPDRMVRILSEIHGAKESVKTGISEVVNFETALLRAAEKGQSRAIDAIIQDIRELKTASSEKSQTCDRDGERQFGGVESRLSGTVRAILNDDFRAQISIMKPDE
ncbi:MAG: DNA polymerase III subunit gamma/tau [Puniceicoccales bacterium]|jgi:DNA polymerase-3 subunit gamma/tau|nr:DNA polymerase III subunit gamma/tau [Puniceicoccales bacterium]